MMLLNFFTICEKDDPDAIKVSNNFGKTQIRPLKPTEVGRLFEVVGNWYSNEEYKNSPLNRYLEKESGIGKVYIKLTMRQSQLAGTEAVMRNDWIKESEVNQHGYIPVYIPFSFYDLDMVVTARLFYLLGNAIRIPG